MNTIIRAIASVRSGRAVRAAALCGFWFTACKPGGSSGESDETTGVSASEGSQVTDASDDEGETSSTGAGTLGTLGETEDSDACAIYTLLATPEELAWTPREDGAVERLALEAAGTFVAPETVYQRVKTDVDAIWAAQQSLYSPAAGWDGIEVRLTEAGTTAVAEGRYDAWDCVHDHYGPVEVVFPNDRAPWLEAGWVDLQFSTAGIYALPELLPFYLGLPEVIDARARPARGIGMDACAEAAGDTFYYIGLWHHDCEQEGCGVQGAVNEAFRTDTPGAITFVGRWDPSESEPPAPPPTWWVEREACRSWLNLDPWPP